jgi:transposase InsO family protein
MALEAIFQSEGNPQIIQSDNGKEFTSNEFKDFCLSRDIQIIHGRPRHPQSQGQVERCNQTVLRFLAKSLYSSPKGVKQWKKILGILYFLLYLGKTVETYNTTIHSATKKTPMEIFRKRNFAPQHLSENNVEIFLSSGIFILLNF